MSRQTAYRNISRVLHHVRRGSSHVVHLLTEVVQGQPVHDMRRDGSGQPGLFRGRSPQTHPLSLAAFVISSYTSVRSL
jgi:hypothetical protein